MFERSREGRYPLFPPGVCLTGGRTVSCRFSFQALVRGGLLAMMLLSGLACQREDVPVGATDGKIAQELFNFQTRHVKDNVLQWTLDAESALFLEPDELRRAPTAGDIRVQRPEVLIYEKGQPAVRITADEGEIFQAAYDLRFIGNVEAVHGDVTIHSKEMYWHNDTGEINAPGRVKLVRGDSVMYGNGLSADPRLKQVHMSEITFTLYSKDENTYVPIQ